MCGLVSEMLIVFVLLQLTWLRADVCCVLVHCRGVKFILSVVEDKHDGSPLFSVAVDETTSLSSVPVGAFESLYAFATHDRDSDIFFSIWTCSRVLRCAASPRLLIGGGCAER